MTAQEVIDAIHARQSTGFKSSLQFVTIRHVCTGMSQFLLLTPDLIFIALPKNYSFVFLQTASSGNGSLLFSVLHKAADFFSFHKSSKAKH